MKRVLFLLFPLMLAIAATAQTTENSPVPTAATRDFANRYASITPKKWKKNKMGQYLAEFRLNRNSSEAYYDADGGWLKTEIRYKSPSKLPAAIRQTLRNSEYASCRFDQILETDSAENKRIYVTASFLDLQEEGPGDSRIYRLTISPEGQLLRSKLIN
jgi:hypothetical protein